MDETHGLNTIQIDQGQTWLTPDGDTHSVADMPMDELEKAFCFLMEMAMEIRVAYEVDKRGGPEKVRAANGQMEVAQVIAREQMETEIVDPIHYAQRWVLNKPLTRAFLRRLADRPA